MATDGRDGLVSVLREAVELAKMIVYRQLKEGLAQRHQDRDPQCIGRLAAGLVNAVFAPEAEQDLGSSPCVEADRALFAAELDLLAASLGELRILVTDTLRIQALCDHQQGLNGTVELKRACELGILLVDRDLPLPHSFLELVRRLAVAMGLVSPLTPKD